MSKQPTISEPACPAMDRKRLKKFAVTLKDIARTKDVDMLPSNHQSLFVDFSLDNYDAGGNSRLVVKLKQDIIPAMVTAIGHVMSLVAKGAGSACVLQGSTACEIVKSLSYNLHTWLTYLDTAHNGQWNQIPASGAQEGDEHLLLKWIQASM